MPFHNYKGEREATTIDSMAYGKKVIELLELRGYYLIKDSNIDGIFQDKIFRRPKFDGDRETVVEIKDTKLSLSDKHFLKELGEYFLLWIRQSKDKRFFFFIFAHTFQNIALWRKIFDEKKIDIEEIQKQIDKIEYALDGEAKDTFKQTSLDDIIDFFSRCEVFQSGYDDLLKKIETIKHEKLFDTTEEYLKEDVNLVYKPETITGNIYKVVKFPNELFIGKIKDPKTANSYWRRSDADKYVPFKNILYSTSEFPKTIIDDFLDPSSVQKILLCDTGLEENELLELKMKVIRAYIIAKGDIVKYWYNRKEKCLYFPHSNLDNEFRKLSAKGHKKRWVVKVVSRQDGEVYYVEHRGIQFNVMYIQNDFYLIFNSKRYFSKDGKRFVDGASADRLHKHYLKRPTLNDAERSKLDFLVNLLDFRTMHWSQECHISITGPIKLEMPCYSETGEIFDDEEDNIQIKTLYDFEGVEDGS